MGDGARESVCVCVRVRERDRTKTMWRNCVLEEKVDEKDEECV